MRHELDRWLARNPVPSQDSSTVDERREYFNSMPSRLKVEYELRKAKADCESSPNLNSATADRAKRRMEYLDGLTPEMRAVVYDLNLEIVREFIQMGITKPAVVRLLIEGVIAGARDPLFHKHGFYVPKKIKHLIGTVLHREFPNGQPRFKLNKGVSAKQNPINYEDEQEEYWVAVRR